MNIMAAKKKIEVEVVIDPSKPESRKFCSAICNALYFVYYKCTRCQEYKFKVRYDCDVPTLMYHFYEKGWLKFIDEKDYKYWVDGKIGNIPIPIPTPESSWVAIWTPGKVGTISYSPMAFFIEDTEYIFTIRECK